MGGGHGADGLGAALRALPRVDWLAAQLDGPPGETVAAARAAVGERRDALRAGAADPAGDGDLADRAAQLLADARRPSLRPVLNATGVVVHTNLGRAPLADAAREAVARAAAGYSNLEWDADTGARGSRGAHVEALLRELTGAQAGLVVNNGAAAVLLCAAALGGPGRAIVVSRGQLIEIGGSFRVPEVVAASGSALVEVGTTNRTRIADYERALDERDDVAALLRAHPSNFRTVGFVAEVEIEALAGLGVPVIDDVGSGVLREGIAALADEPPVRRSVAAGAALVCFSGDKLLGGPQAGIVVGRAAEVARARRHPLARAMRIDKLSLAALEATLRLHRDPVAARRELPVLAMLDAPEATLRARADAMAALLRAAGLAVEVRRASGRVGGGALPLLELEGPVVALEAPGRRADALAARLRAGEPAVAARIHEGALLLDPRTLTDEESRLAVGAVLAATA